MNSSSDKSRSLPHLAPRLDAWGRWLHGVGLDGLAGVLLDASAPLAPLGAQLLYVAQPTLGLAISAEMISELARVLDDPDGLIWLRDELGLGDRTDGEAT